MTKSPKEHVDLERVKEGEELCLQLMQYALKNENSSFTFIRCLRERINLQEYIRNSLAPAEKLFRRLYTATQKAYLEQIRSGAQELQAILALKQFKYCQEYYKKEIAVAKDILDEHKEYVLSGHIIDTLLGNIRKEEDLVDYRKLPTRWF